MQPPPRGRALRSRSPRCASTTSASILSVTAGEVPLADVLQEALRGLLHEVEDVLEAIGAAVVGIGHCRLRGVRSEIEEWPHHGATPAKSSNRPVVLLVHREDVIEVLAILRLDAACPLGAYVHATEGGGAQGPVIGRGADVPSAGSCGVNGDLALQALPPKYVLEYALSKRGAADVAHADEEYAYHDQILEY